MGINDLKMDEFYLIVESDVRRCKIEKGTDLFQFLGCIIDLIKPFVHSYIASLKN